jgi:hypothetical protein
MAAWTLRAVSASMPLRGSSTGIGGWSGIGRTAPNRRRRLMALAR